MDIIQAEAGIVFQFLIRWLSHSIPCGIVLFLLFELMIYWNPLVDHWHGFWYQRRSSAIDILEALRYRFRKSVKRNFNRYRMLRRKLVSCRNFVRMQFAVSLPLPVGKEREAIERSMDEAIHRANLIRFAENYFRTKKPIHLPLAYRLARRPEDIEAARARLDAGTDQRIQKHWEEVEERKRKFLISMGHSPEDWEGVYIGGLHPTPREKQQEFEERVGVSPPRAIKQLFMPKKEEPSDLFEPWVPTESEKETLRKFRQAVAEVREARYARHKEELKLRAATEAAQEEAHPESRLARLSRRRKSSHRRPR